jgi:hypothetical protein
MRKKRRFQRLADAHGATRVGKTPRGNLLDFPAAECIHWVNTVLRLQNASYFCCSALADACFVRGTCAGAGARAVSHRFGTLRFGDGACPLLQ